MRKFIQVLLIIFISQILILPKGSGKYTIETSEETNHENNSETEADEIIAMYPYMLANDISMSNIPLNYPSNPSDSYFIKDNFMKVDTPPPILI